MASKPQTGPDEQERNEPGDTQPNPARKPGGVSADEPAEGGEDESPRQPGSPAG